MAERAIKIRIYPTKEQKEKIEKSLNCSRFVFNKALALRNYRYENHKASLREYELSFWLTLWKKSEEYSWLKEANAQGLQQSLKNLEDAFSRFFRGLGKYPKFKKKSGKQSFTVIGNSKNIRIEDNKIKFPKVGWLDCKGLRKYSGSLKKTTLSKTPSGQYFISFCLTDMEKLEKVKEIKSHVGIDSGIKTLAVCSDGNSYHFLNLLDKYQEKIKYYQRKRAKCKKGSKKYKEHSLKIAVIWRKITNYKKDFLHKLSREIVKNHDLISVENLQIRNMVKNHKLARKILNMNWGMFFHFLEYKCEWYGKYFIKIPPQNTSKKCSNCGFIFKQLELKDREWVCPHCHVKHDRDFNASINIDLKGLDEFLKSCGDILIRVVCETRIPCL